MHIPVMAMPIDVCSIDVLFHEESTHAHFDHWYARTRRTEAHARRRCDGCESASDPCLPPPHRGLLLYGVHNTYTGPNSPNKLVCVPGYSKHEIPGTPGLRATQQPHTQLIAYSGPRTICNSCAAGKFSTAAGPRCSTVYNQHRPLRTCLLIGILLPRMYDVAAASLSSPSILVYFVKLLHVEL